MIVTREEIKSLLSISGTTYDAIIDVLIPVAEQIYSSIMGIDFFRFGCDITNGSSTLSNVYDKCDLEEGQTVELVDSVNTFRSVISYVPRYVPDYIDEPDYFVRVQDDATFDEENVIMKVYPKGSKYAASQIVWYYINNGSKKGDYESESFGNYSYTLRDQSTEGLPHYILALIPKYASLHDGCCDGN